mmetsp:Transcript_37259/g.64667  ORF Transcript_37259/g.64667 Transcript_37259/m.64667 type:complete len:325 (+) Transcript_37259:108-1082(+)
MHNLDTINGLLRAPQALETRRDKLKEAIDNFLMANLDPSNSPNLLHEAPDDIMPLFEVFGAEVFRRSDLLVPMLKVAKVLMRKQANRALIQDAHVLSLIPVLSSPKNVMAAREAANVVLNMCYDSQNVSTFVQNGGARALLPLTQSADIHLQGSALGALQSVSYQKEGRSALRDIGAVAAVCSLLASEHHKVVARAVGAVHNLSADAQSLRLIREAGGLGGLVPLLRSHEAEVCALAAGALQNLSREQASRAALAAAAGGSGGGAVGPLADLLVGGDVQAQASAAGALWNIVGPDLDEMKREAFRVFLTDSIVMGMIGSCFQSR